MSGRENGREGVSGSRWEGQPQTEVQLQQQLQARPWAAATIHFCILLCSCLLLVPASLPPAFRRSSTLHTIRNTLTDTHLDYLTQANQETIDSGDPIQQRCCLSSIRLRLRLPPASLPRPSTHTDTENFEGKAPTCCSVPPSLTKLTPFPDPSNPLTHPKGPFIVHHQVPLRCTALRTETRHKFTPSLRARIRTSPPASGTPDLSRLTLCYYHHGAATTYQVPTCTLPGPGPVSLLASPHLISPPTAKSTDCCLPPSFSPTSPLDCSHVHNTSTITCIAILSSPIQRVPISAPAITESQCPSPDAYYSLCAAGTPRLNPPRR
ncbi:hypothetical protein CABS01_12874 [Colletotrichum abscissum]|uniref:Uncharacterized protein n=1 Tax=Colletotrichum abscissum TaxID=1671311 RepID=A0A9P9XDZ1_9PEZI|nr:uncharacterized protein CABS01_12874 [Colletotrichum abscissum]KAI3550752.1 hypothetical protein CABS02_07551 [Colletotrichum abscissum]KAK1487999.1 hypothetical protein CABS01_12874 [Colletotrichum abscissum]